MSIGYINSGSVAEIDQDNKDVAKYVTLNKFGQSPLPNRILSFLNNSNPFTVTEIQNLWIFVNVVYDNNEIVEIQKIKVFNKGKGTYGAGNLQFTLSDLKLISTESLTSGAIESNPLTQVITITQIGTLNVAQYISQANPSIEFQNVGVAPRLVKITEAGKEADYLFLASGGVYGQGQLQTTDSDFQILNENSSISDATKEDKVSGVIAYGTDEYNATVPEVTQLVTGLKILVTFENPNTGASRMNLNALTDEPIVKNYDTPVVAGDLTGTMTLMYSLDKWVVVGSIGGAGAIVQDNHAKVIEFDLLTTFGTPDFAALTAGAISDKLNILSADILPIEIPFVKISKDVTGLYQIYVLEGIGAGNTSAVVASNVKLLVDASNDFTTALNGKQATLNETNFGSFANALNEKTIIVDDDVAIIGDSEDSNKAKKSKWSTIKNYFANLFILRSGTTAGNPITGDLEIRSKNNEEKALILSKEGTVGITENPKFSFGRIVNGGINEPKLRILFTDDEAYTSEITCFEVEPSGTAASVRQVIGSHYEAFLEQEEKPLFRIASFLKDGNKSTRMEFGSGGNEETDIFLERWASWAFALVMGGSPKVIFYPDSILRQPGVVDAFQQTPIGQVVATPNPDVKKLFYREGKGLVELGGDGIEKPLVNNNSYSTTETLTGGTWIDGKPIYRKVFTVADTSGDINNTHSLPIETLIYSNLKTKEGTIFRNEPLMGAGGLGFCGVSETHYWIYNQNLYSLTNISITLEYTKTTD